jgi:hypothetical protein
MVQVLELQVHKVPKELQVFKALQDFKAYQDHKDKLGFKVFKESKDLKVL